MGRKKGYQSDWSVHKIPSKRIHPKFGLKTQTKVIPVFPVTITKKGDK
jgi:hypothetical protein